MKTCLIYQPQGIGDILFCQKIAKHYRALGYKIIWPLFDSFAWLAPYLEEENISYPTINSDRTIREKFEHCDQFQYLMGSTNALFQAPVIAKDFIYLSLGPATLDWTTIMTAKYNIAQIPFVNWASYVNIKRNLERENYLFSEILNLKEDDEYTLINKHSSLGSIDVKIPGKSVYIEKVPNDNLFDWIKVIEKCSRFISIDTGSVYLAEAYMPRSVPCHMVSKSIHNEFFVDVQRIMTLNWQYCITPDQLIIDNN